MIIRLTEIRENGKIEVPVYVNFDHVQAFNKSSKGKDTHLKVIGQAYFFVKESPEEIMNMLYPVPIMAEASMVTEDMRDNYIRNPIVRMK